MSARIVQTCEQCGQPFSAWAKEVERGRAKFCSSACYHAERGIRQSRMYAERAAKTANGKERACSRCGAVKLLHATNFVSLRSGGLSSHCHACVRPHEPIDLRFWKRVNKNGPVIRAELGPCWVWTAFIPKNGYGRLSIKIDGRHKSEGAHRVSFYLANGHWPEPCCLHKCDNPPCVNPDHLYEGTKTDNNNDMTARGRRTWTVGEGQANAKLTDQAVRDIRAAVASGEKQESVRARYGLSLGAVSRIVHRKRWAHVA